MTNIAEYEEAVGASRQGHPRGLYVLFGAEMWERFSYYGMRALLVLYLTKHLKFSENDALGVFAMYTSLVYMTPLLGGYLADRYLGQRKAILIGGSLMALGHFAMAFEPLLNLALGLLILGNGFFKPNISTMVGQLYSKGDPRRDGAYTIFYMGINLGATFSPLVCGTLGESTSFGWHYGFGAAGVGMVFGLVTFAMMQGALGNQGYPTGRDASARGLTAGDWVHIAVLVLGGVGLVYLAIWPAATIVRQIPALGKSAVLAYWFGLALVMVVLTALVTRAGRVASKPSPETETGAAAARPADAEADERSAPFTFEDWQRILVILIVALFSIVFWMGFEQAGGTFTLFADQKTDRVILGRAFPASWYQSVNPLLIIALAPLFSMIWTTLDRTRFAMTSTAKMGVGLILLGIGFVIMASADRLAAKTATVGAHWLATVYLFNTMGELCLSPIGLSMVNKLAPARIASLMMAIWFVSTAIANYFAGMLHGWLEHANINLWTFLMLTSFVPGIILLALTPVLKKMAHGRL